MLYSEKKIVHEFFLKILDKIKIGSNEDQLLESIHNAKIEVVEFLNKPTLTE